MSSTYSRSITLVLPDDADEGLFDRMNAKALRPIRADLYANGVISSVRRHGPRVVCHFEGEPALVDEAISLCEQLQAGMLLVSSLDGRVRTMEERVGRLEELRPGFDRRVRVRQMPN